MSEPRLFRRVKHVHMIGIGGAGMSGIAEVLLNLGFQVSGSDLQTTEITERLSRLGARIERGHSPENVHNADVVVYSSAVKPENPEIRAARDSGIPQIPRSEMLAELMRLKIGVAVSGTHGKTTTTSMIGTILNRAQLNPTLIVGGIVRALQSGVNMGSGDLLIVEADEFDRSFLKLTPTLAVITTIEPEHLDTYTDLAGVQDAFVEFANRIPFYGSVIICSDEPNINAILPRIKRPIVKYGLGNESRFAVNAVTYHDHFASFSFTTNEGSTFKCNLQVPGQHNVLNALAALTVADELDVPLETACTALADFTGVHRRFEILGDVNGITVVDDYAHHPTEVLNTLRTAKQCWPKRRIVALFQPHLFTRTRDFAREFAVALGIADLGLITDIYPSRELPLPGVTSDLIVTFAHELGYSFIRAVGAIHSSAQIQKYLVSGDVVIVMGAGSITHVAREFVQRNG